MTRPTTKFEQAFFDGIKNFAFYDDLNVACQRIAGKDIPGLMEEGNYKAVVSALLGNSRTELRRTTERSAQIP